MTIMRLEDDIDDPTTTMTQIDYDYYEWLTSQIAIPNGRTYEELFERMHNLEFVWIVPHDNNRLQDALDLRVQYMNEFPGRLAGGSATFLEVLIALSRRTAFTAGGEAEDWAWKLLKNLRLTKAYDPWTAQKARSTEEILETVIWRTYHHSGKGGFFPLKDPFEDQTKVEIWYQMNAYVNEMYGS